MKPATLRCFAYFLFLFYASTFENLGDQGSAYLHVVYVQIGLRMSFHELFKHTFYPSLSLCFAYLPFLFYASTFENLGDQDGQQVGLTVHCKALTLALCGLTMALQWPYMALQWPYMALHGLAMALHGLTMALHGLTM